MGHAEQLEDEKVLGLKHHKSTFSGSYEKYKENIYEKDADARVVRREKERKSQKKEKSEILQQLDKNDNQILDSSEDVEIKPIEIKDED